MTEEKAIEERLKLLEREIATLGEGLDALKAALEDVEDLKTELKAFKVFAGRHQPEFKKEFPEILQKITGEK